MHGAMRCFDEVFDLVKEVLKEICIEDKQQLPRQWGERRACQEEEIACVEDLRCKGAWWRQRIWCYFFFFFKPTCLKKKEWPRWKIRPERRWRPHLAGHVLGSGDRDENKNIFTGHVEIFCRNNLWIVKITLATLGEMPRWVDELAALAGSNLRIRGETCTWGVASWSLRLLSPTPPSRLQSITLPHSWLVDIHTLCRTLVPKQSSKSTNLIRTL